MAVLVSRRHDTAKLANVSESLDLEHKAQAETQQLLADLKDKEAVAREMIAILKGVRGRDGRYDRKAALKVLAKVKQRRALAEQILRRSQNSLKGMGAQCPTTGRLPILPPSAILGSGEVSGDRLPGGQTSSSIRG